MLREIVEAQKNKSVKYELMSNMGGDGEMLVIGETPDGMGIVLGFSEEEAMKAEIEINWGENQYEIVVIDDVASEVMKNTGLKLDVKNALFKKLCHDFFGFVPKG